MATSITGNSYTNENIQNIQSQIDKANETLNRFNATQKTDEELRQQATNEYNPIYNAQVQEQEALKQSAASTLADHLSALDRQYARDQETLGRSYDTQRVNANNSMLARGFNNSSLAVAMLNHVETERNRALQNLAAERAAGETSARNAYNNAITAADKAIGRLGSDLQANIDARYQALKDADYNRVFQAQQAQNQVTQYINELMLQLEQLRQEGYDQYLKEQQAQWERDVYERENSGSSGGGSGSGSGGSSSGTSSTQTGSDKPKSSLEEQFNSGNKGSTAIVEAVRNTAKSTISGANTAKSSLASLYDTVKKAASTAAKTPAKAPTNKTAGGALLSALTKK